jgi:nicotinamidase-related amidase
MTMDAIVKYGANAADYAGRLLAAARALELPTNVVVFSPDGHYTVPEEVADKAGVSYDVLDSDEPVYVEGPEAEDLLADVAAADPDGSGEGAKVDEAEKAPAKKTKKAKVVVPRKGEDGYLAGKGLEAALESRGLPSEGRADDKRLAVATYDAENKE